MSDHWNAKKYKEDAAFVPALGEEVFNLLAPKARESILDLGCGDGLLTKRMKDLGCNAVGIDSSQSMVDEAKKKGLVVYRMSGDNMHFNKNFNAVFSNAALHWMKRPSIVINNVRSVLNCGGRFVGEFGGYGNIQTLRSAIYDVLRKMGRDPAALDPWYFPTQDSYQELLELGGFKVEQIKLFNRPTPILGDITDWLEIFSTAFQANLSPSKKENFISDVRSKVCKDLQSIDGSWIIDYTRLQFSAKKIATNPP